MQKNPEAIGDNDLLISKTYTATESWSFHSVVDINNYSSLVITFIGTPTSFKSYSVNVLVADLPNITLNNPLVITGTADTNSIYFARYTDTQLMIYNSYGTGTIYVRGIR